MITQFSPICTLCAMNTLQSIFVPARSGSASTVPLRDDGPGADLDVIADLDAPDMVVPDP